MWEGNIQMSEKLFLKFVINLNEIYLEVYDVIINKILERRH